ncbi:MAG: endonuclease domain-containing protein [Patescibacteria group bacterium]
MNTKDKRRYLRSNMTRPEQILWVHLRKRRLSGYKFRRQVSIGNYIVDFYCPQLKLVVEVDGDSHYTEKAITYDIQRDKWISDLGITIIRFTNFDVSSNTEGVVNTIEQNIERLNKII